MLLKAAPDDADAGSRAACDRGPTTHWSRNLKRRLDFARQRAGTAARRRNPRQTGDARLCMTCAALIASVRRNSP
jgi:hypothetical protein